MCSRECRSKKAVLKARNIHSAPNLPQQCVEKPMRRACSCVRVEKLPESRDSASIKEKVTLSSNNNCKYCNMDLSDMYERVVILNCKMIILHLERKKRPLNLEL